MQFRDFNLGAACVVASVAHSILPLGFLFSSRDEINLRGVGAASSACLALTLKFD